jgi:DMSO/TMAO reductase YedYZ molybdopterin-dependent catalytic subunit
MKKSKRLLPLVLMSLSAALLISCAGLSSGTSTPEDPHAILADLIYQDPAEVDNSNLPITPVDKLNVTGPSVAPEVNIAEYRLTVDGLVARPLSMTYGELMDYSSVTEVVLLICPFTFADNAEWTGVSLSTILAEAGVESEATEIHFYALDGYSVTLSQETAQKDGVFLAYAVDGQVLPAEHGYPLRLVVKGQYGDRWIKWVERIEVR